MASIAAHGAPPSALPSALLSTFLCAAMAPTGALAADAVGSTTLELAHARDRLDNGGSDWRESGLRATHVFAPRQAGSLALTRTERFGLSDSEVSGSVSLPLSGTLVATVDGARSATHRVLARHSFAAALQYEFAHAWLVHGALKRSKYDATGVTQGTVMLERYVGAYSAALAWRPTRTDFATVHGYSAHASWYYGERNVLGVVLATGQEATSLPLRVVLSDVRSAALTGRHALSPDWFVRYALSKTRQSGLYTRTGMSIGLAHVF